MCVCSAKPHFECQAYKEAAELERINNARERRAQEAELGVLRNQRQSLLRALGVDEATISSLGPRAMHDTLLKGKST